MKKMVNLKTKSDKHTTDNEKRCKSIKEKEKAKLNQSLIIKEALSNNGLNSSKSKKIVFSNDGDDDESDDKQQVRHENVNGKDRIILFDGSDSEGENFEIKEKTQFSGKKGFELLNLQSTYGNDERFKIDERFLENDKGDIKEDQGAQGEHGDDGKFNSGDEKVNQLKILESVLGESINATQKNEKKAKKRTFEMVHYDASKKEHEIYEIKHESETNERTKKRKERKKIERLIEEEPNKPQVSKEKFYEVSSDIKNNFIEKKEEAGGSFSLLQTYGENNIIDSQNDKEDNYYVNNVKEETVNFNVGDKRSMNTSNNRLVKKDNKMIVEKSKAESKGTVAKGIWKESFFFAPDDPRFKEALEFMNKKGSDEAMEAADNYDKTRRQLKEILRLHMKKQLHKKDPFKNKVGGMNKKQLANLKMKNSKLNFSKRKFPRMNPGGKI